MVGLGPLKLQAGETKRTDVQPKCRFEVEKILSTSANEDVHLLAAYAGNTEFLKLNGDSVDLGNKRVVVIDGVHVAPALTLSVEVVKSRKDRAHGLARNRGDRVPVTLERLSRVVEQVSFGGFRPLVTVEVTTKITSTEEAPAILIGINTVDAMSSDTDPIRLYECFIAPDIDDVSLARWIKERCQDVLLHEMDEFFRFRGEIVDMAAHPVAEGVFDAVRERRHQP